MNDELKMLLTSILIVGLTLLALWSMAVKVDGQPSSYYSLIVVDRTDNEWVVDYNLTEADCLNMVETEAAYCAEQPKGKLP